MNQRVPFKEAETIVKQRLDILDIIGRHVALRKAGRNQIGLCPFHQEKTPSFSVSHDKQLFKCFGCGVGGDALSFLMQLEGKTYGEIITDLAADQGIEILKEGRHRQAEQDNLDVLIQLHTLARSYYQEQLRRHPTAEAYLAKRRIGLEWQNHFGLGYAPSGWENLIKHLRQQMPAIQQNPTLLEKSGLVNSKGEGSSFYDRFRNRLMIPIADERGRVVAFGARSLDPEEEPKYLNSPETPIYTKNRILYGFSQAKEAIRSTRSVVLMEGYFDVISAHMAGLSQSVGICGTSLTENHLKLLQRTGAETIYLCFDTDNAGQTATLRAIDLLENHLLEQGISLKVVALPDGKDPDEFFQAHGREDFLKCLETAQHFLNFKFDKTLAQVADIHSPEGRIQAVQRITPILLGISQPVVRQEYIKQLAEKLQLAEETLILELKHKERGNPAYSYKKNQESGAIFGSQERLVKKRYRDTPLSWRRPEDIAIFRKNLSGKIPVDEKEHILLSYLFINEESYRFVMDMVEQLQLQSPIANRFLQAVKEVEGQWTTIHDLIRCLTEHFHRLEDKEQLPFLAHQVLAIEDLRERYNDSGKGLKSLTDREKLRRDIHDIVSKIRFLYQQTSLNVLAKDGRQHEQQDDDQSALQIQLQLREHLMARKKTASQPCAGISPEEKEQGV